MERKSTYPPEAVRDQVRQPAGTARSTLTKPGNPDPTCRFQVFTAEQARKVALPVFESGVKPTMTSK
jgi:hypothetical protein